MAVSLANYVWLGFAVMRLRPWAPISTGKTHRRIPHGKTQTLTDRHQQESVAPATVPIKIQSHAWALERAGSPVHHQHVGKTHVGHSTHGTHLGPLHVEPFPHVRTNRGPRMFLGSVLTYAHTW